MATLAPLLAALGAGTRRALPYIRSAVEGGLNTSQISDLLRGAGLPFRRQDMLAAVRHYRDVVIARPTLRSVRDSFHPAPESFRAPISTTLRRFSYVTSVIGRSLETGEDKSISITISSSTSLTVGEIKRAALEIANRIQAPDSGYSSDMALEPERAVLDDALDRDLIPRE